MSIAYSASPVPLETELANLLNDLLSRQGDLMEILDRKRTMLGKVDREGLAHLAEDEKRLLGLLQDSLDRRERLLARAKAEGLPATSIEALTKSLPATQRDPLVRQVATAGSRSRILQTQSLTNWIIIQRTLIHLSRLLEIIATGGRLQPTYGEMGNGLPHAWHADAHGTLLNQEA
jgi:flagellar biosynthesis/type III secretory pathway chaperone